MLKRFHDVHLVTLFKDKGTYYENAERVQKLINRMSIGPGYKENQSRVDAQI